MSAVGVTITDPDAWATEDETHAVVFHLTPVNDSTVRVSDEILQQLVDAAAARGFIARPKAKVKCTCGLHHTDPNCQWAGHRP